MPNRINKQGQTFAKNKWPAPTKAMLGTPMGITEQARGILAAIGAPFFEVEKWGEGFWLQAKWPRLPPTNTTFSFDEANLRHQKRSKGLREIEHIITKEELSQKRAESIRTILRKWEFHVQSDVQATVLFIDEFLASLQMQKEARLALSSNIKQIKCPPLDSVLLNQINSNSHNSIRQLDQAIKQARKAQTLVAPLKRKFLGKHPKSVSTVTEELMNLMVKKFKLSVNKSANLTFELLQTFDLSETPVNADSIRIAYHNKTRTT